MTSRVQVRHFARAVEERKGDREFPLLSVSAYLGVIRRSEITADEPRAEDLSNYRVCASGDIVINRMSAYQGALGKAKEDGVVSPDYLVLRLNDCAHPAFIEHLFRSHAFVSEMASRVRGIGSASLGTVRTPRINWSDLGAIEVELPSHEFQRQIAEYLDRETGRTDELISKQQQLIDTLIERREATVSRVITHGLDGSVGMKESGSVWFGVIPEHWQLGPCGLYTEMIQTGPFGSQLHSEEYIAGGVALVNPMHIVDGSIVRSETMSVTLVKAEELNRHALRVDDVVVARRGELGRSAVVTPESEGYLCGTGSAIVRLKVERMDPRYFQLVFSSRQSRDSLLQYSIGSTMDNLNSSTISALRIPIPPIGEQRDIVEFVAEQSNRVGVLIGNARKAIELLRERRAALISAAVTGKIDVRGL
jgi:type I restriction enzyme, S subunit